MAPIIDRRKQTATALVGDGRIDVLENDGDFLTVECNGADVWEFRSAYDSLPLIVEYAGAKYLKVSYRSDTQRAFYKVA